MKNIEDGTGADRRPFTRAEARAAAAAWMAEARALPEYPAAERRVRAQQVAARALRRMRERAALTQAEVARRMDVKAPAVSRLEKSGATTLQALFGYAAACGYRVRITAESAADRFAFA